MRTTKEGYNTFSNYNTIKIYIDYSQRGKFTNSLQITWGGVAQFDETTINNDIANYNIRMKRYFRNKVKDGYFTDRFIYINDVHESTYDKSEGLFFPKLFLFLEETYEKTFVVDYLKTIFDDLEAYHRTHKTIRFQKYYHRKVEWN